MNDILDLNYSLVELKADYDQLESAYNKMKNQFKLYVDSTMSNLAQPICCNQSNGIECCGDPLPTWPDWMLELDTSTLTETLNIVQTNELKNVQMIGRGLRSTANKPQVMLWSELNE